MVGCWLVLSLLLPLLLLSLFIVVAVHRERSDSGEIPTEAPAQTPPLCFQWVPLHNCANWGCWAMTGHFCHVLAAHTMAPVMPLSLVCPTLMRGGGGAVMKAGTVLAVAGCTHTHTHTQTHTHAKALSHILPHASFPVLQVL